MTFLLIVLVITFALFFFLSRHSSPLSTKTWIDRYIPLVPAMIVPYVSFFILVPVALVQVVPTVSGVEFVYALIIAMWSATPVWYFMPTRITRPSVAGRGVLKLALRTMYAIDRSTNNFPSPHVFLSLLCGYYWTLVDPHYAGHIWVWVALVVASTVYVKQHNMVDVLGGMVWALSAVALVQWFMA